MKGLSCIHVAPLSLKHRGCHCLSDFYLFLLILGLREPSAAFLAGSNKHALKHHGSSRKAAAVAVTPYYTEWRILKKLEQPQVSKQRRIGPLSALDNKAEPTAYLASTQRRAQLFISTMKGQCPRYSTQRLSSGPPNAMQRCWRLTWGTSEAPLRRS